MDEYASVELTLDNDEVVECAILTVLEANGNEYIALFPIDENGDPEDDSDIFLYRFSEDENDEPILENIEDDEEFEIASTALDDWFDAQDFDEEEN